MPDTPQQGEFTLEAPPLPEDAPFLPARMVNEYVYCPRLAYLEWVQGEWGGERRHRRGRPCASPGRSRGPAAAIGRGAGRAGAAAHPFGHPVVAPARSRREDRHGGERRRDRRAGRPTSGASARTSPPAPGSRSACSFASRGCCWRRTAIAAPRACSTSPRAASGYASSFDEELRDATRSAIGGLRLVAAGGRIPAPLRDSPKCPRCSLVGICLPDEVNHFRRTGATPRPIAVRHDEMLPLYVQPNNGAPRQEGRDHHHHRGGRADHDGAAHRHLAGRADGQREDNHPVPARADASGDSGDMAQLRRLVPRSHRGGRAQERRAARGAVSRELRPCHFARRRAVTGGRPRYATPGR